MRSSWFMSFWLGTLMLVLLGCRNTGPDLRPPKQSEEYNLPPANDSSYDKPVPTPPDPNNNSSGNKSGSGMGSFKGPGGGGGGGMMGGGGGGGGMMGSRGY